MTHAWFSRTTTASHAWADLGAGVINGDATVLDSVERDFVMVWQQHASVEADLVLLWQQDANPITAVESELALTWNVITEAGSYVEADLELLWQRAGSVTASLNLLWQVAEAMDVAGASTERRAPIRHPGWQRKQAADQLARERAMDRSIRVALNGEEAAPAALKVELPPQRTAAQMAAEMANAQRVQAARQRATEAAIEAQRARREIERLQPTLLTARRQASYRVIEQLLRQA